MWWHTVTHGRGSEGETGEWSGYPVPFTLPRNMVYPALLLLIRTPRLPVVDWTDAPADLNGLVRFAERRNLVSARVPSHLKRSLHHVDVTASAAILERKCCTKQMATDCQNVLRDVFSSPGACLQDYRTSPQNYGNVHFVLYQLRYAFMINHDITRDSTNNRINGIKRVWTDTKVRSSCASAPVSAAGPTQRVYLAKRWF
jgi:hypothetical protein